MCARENIKKTACWIAGHEYSLADQPAPCYDLAYQKKNAQSGGYIPERSKSGKVGLRNATPRNFHRKAARQQHARVRPQNGGQLDGYPIRAGKLSNDVQDRKSL